jgi:stress response protein YsnF/sporulation protein YlmC with PRC-barrel domain
MTMQAEQLIGARVTGGDGQVVGTVQQVFNDDTDGRPVWARIRAGTRDRFVPLAGGQVTKDGLSVPYDAKQIMSSPEIGADRHISAAQTDQLRRHFGLTVPAQGGPPDVGPPAGTQPGEVQGSEAQREEARRGQARQGEAVRGQAPGEGAERGQTTLGEGQRGEGQRGESRQDEAMRGQPRQDEAKRGQPRQDEAMRGESRQDEAMRGQARQDEAMRGQARQDEAMRGQARQDEAVRGDGPPREAQRGEAERAGTRPGETLGDEAGRDGEWLVRAEERVDVGTEMLESGRARLHKYVDVEPVEQAVSVFHEEYEVERVPITAEEQIRGVIAEGEQEIILHEERPVFHKEAVAVERVRLVVKRVAEDRTFREEIRKERIEVEADDTDRERAARSADQAQASRPRRLATARHEPGAIASGQASGSPWRARSESGDLWMYRRAH